MRLKAVFIISLCALNLAACQTSDIGTVTGGLLGAGAGGFAVNKFLGKGRGKTFATAGGVAAVLLGSAGFLMWIGGRF